MKVFAFVRRHWFQFSCALFGAAGAVMSFVLVGASGGDDPYITYWVADRFAATGKIVNYNGAHLEQSSSLAQVVILGVLHAVTRVPVPLLGALLGFVSFAAASYVAGVWARRHSPTAGVIASVMVAFAYPLVYWAAGGLETLLVPFFVVWLLHLVHRAVDGGEWSRRAAVKLFVVALFASAIRPDALLMVVITMAALALVALVHKWAPRFALRVLPAVDAAGVVRAMVTVACAVVVLEVFRLAWFGALMPQPVSAKSGFTFELGRGKQYLLSSLPPAWLAIPLLVLLVAGVWHVVRARMLMGWLSGFVAVVWMAEVVVSGGDWMGMARMFVPAVVLLLVLCAVGVVQVAGMIARGFTRFVRSAAGVRGLGTTGGVVGVAVCVVVLELLACSLLVRNPQYFAGNMKTYLPAMSTWTAIEGVGDTQTEVALPSDVPWYERRNSPHLRDAIFLKRLEPWLKSFVATRSATEPVTFASIQAGMIPYYVKKKFGDRIRFIDMASLSTNDFSKCTMLKRGKYGTIILLPQWEKLAGGCAPPLPDLFLEFAPQSTATLGTQYGVVLSQDLQLIANGKVGDANLEFAIRNDLVGAVQ